MTHDQKDSADFDLGMNTTPGMWEMVSDELDGVSLPVSVSKAIHALASGSAKIWPLMGYGESCDNYFEQTATPEQVRLMARQLKEIADEVERKAAQLEPYQQRMLDEHAELSDRISKLEAFTGTEAFEQLPELERCLMSHQLIDMHGYAGILRHRIRLWSKSDD